MNDFNALLAEAEEIETKYKEHFGTGFPDRMAGWWNPLDIMEYPNELSEGIQKMKQDVDKAISSNEPFKEIPNEQWEKMIF